MNVRQLTMMFVAPGKLFSGDAHSPAVLPWQQILAECVSVCVYVCLELRGLVDCSVGGGAKAVGGPGSSGGCRGVRGKRGGQC